jgi:L-iditol 2-dehydrogenase
VAARADDPLCERRGRDHRRPSRLLGRDALHRRGRRGAGGSIDGLTKIAPGPENVGVTERPEPVALPGYVVLAVEAAGICGTDLHIVDDEFRSWPPVTMGHEVCGVVAELGADVDPAWLGARVVSETYFSTCGTCRHCVAGRVNLCPERHSIGSARDGAFAPRLLVPAHGLHRVPDWLPSAAAVLVEPLACVCNCLDDPPRIEDGDAVLVIGPGPVGLLAAQAARAARGTVHVRGTARDALRLRKARELGFATSVAGDASDDVPDAPADGFDVVIECYGSEHGMRLALQQTRRGGRYVQVGLAGGPVTVPLDEVCYRELTVSSGNASTPRSWRRALELIGTRAVDLDPLVTSVHPLADWERAFAAARAGEGIKVVLDPR